ncbi:hypothetical protein M440DRAFT_1397053 [Trichoderma longibrachiatum ATCC 18648]|uniref:Uncharacterized protein n=1 Tax=Trichoderma longibrachiatum ATCC 18648 TaxID=983965 RepID=A0A2T4CJY6_TRILO|nr:hypothetical protein M440DRAFT_1397053 [Trichoderma longibrachiatum ATCC 18648]
MLSLLGLNPLQAIRAAGACVTAGPCTGALSRPSSSIYGLLWATVSVFVSLPSRLASATPNLCLSLCPFLSFIVLPFRLWQIPRLAPARNWPVPHS